MAGGFAIKVNRFAQAAKAADKATSELVRTLAFAIQEQAQTNIQAVGAIDTGAMRSSVYAQTAGKDYRPQAVALAKGRNADADMAVAPAGPSHEHQARVGVAVEYAIYVEMGTVNMAARPYLLPAAKEIEGEVDQIGKRIFEAEGL